MGWRVGRRAAVMGCAAWLATSAAQAQYYAPDPPLPEIPWYEMLELHAFVDAYASVNYNFPRPQWGNETFRSFDATTGFALSWVGVDASFQPDPIGGTLSLRYGPSAEILADRCLHEDRQANPCDTDLGLHVLQQAFGSWAPGGAEGVLRLDFGKFDSIYGIERAEAVLAGDVEEAGLGQRRFQHLPGLPHQAQFLHGGGGEQAHLDPQFGRHLCRVQQIQQCGHLRSGGAAFAAHQQRTHQAHRPHRPRGVAGVVPRQQPAGAGDRSGRVTLHVLQALLSLCDLLLLARSGCLALRRDGCRHEQRVKQEKGQQGSHLQGGVHGQGRPTRAARDVA